MPQTIQDADGCGRIDSNVWLDGVYIRKVTLAMRHFRLHQKVAIMTRAATSSDYIRVFSLLSSPPADTSRPELAHHVIRLRALAGNGALEHMGESARVLLADCERRLKELPAGMNELIEAHREAEVAYLAACRADAGDLDRVFDVLVEARNALLARLPTGEDEAIAKRAYIASSDDLTGDEFGLPAVADLLARLCEYRPAA